eukprot:scaffold625009_cov35-Attheya_sp.AAC.1
MNCFHLQVILNVIIDVAGRVVGVVAVPILHPHDEGITNHHVFICKSANEPEAKNPQLGG